MRTRTAGLSPWARDVWTELLRDNAFSANELVLFHRALRWCDISDRQIREADALKGRERDAKLKSAGDSATSALRCWRTLRFVDPSTPARRPGRPPKVRWHPTARADGGAA